MNQYNKDGSKPYCYAEVWNTVNNYRDEKSLDHDHRVSTSLTFQSLLSGIDFTKICLTKQTIAIWRITLKK